MSAKVPRHFQREGIDWIHYHNGRVLLADEMGLGKTLQALWWCQEAKAWPAVVVCPASVKYTWEREAREVGIRPEVLEGTTPPLARLTAPHALTILNYDILKDWVGYLQQVGGVRTIIADECHYCQNLKAKRTQALRALATGVPHFLGISGTPLTNRPAELWPVLNILWPHVFNSFWQFGQAHCRPKWTRWGWQYNGATNIQQLHEQLVGLGMVRRRKADVLGELPDKVRQVVPLPLTDWAEYQHADGDFLGWLAANGGPDKVRRARKAEVITKMNYLRQIAARLKLWYAVDWINRYLAETEPTQKAVIFYIHTKAGDALARRVNAKMVRVDGTVTGNHRKAAEDQFREDPETRVLLGQYQAAGVGLNLQVADTVIGVELPWKPGDLSQAEDRIHRMGQKAVSWIYYLIAGGTIEDWLAEINQDKQGVITGTLDGTDCPVELDVFDQLMARMAERSVAA